MPKHIVLILILLVYSVAPGFAKHKKKHWFKKNSYEYTIVKNNQAPSSHYTAKALKQPSNNITPVIIEIAPLLSVINNIDTSNSKIILSTSPLVTKTPTHLDNKKSIGIGQKIKRQVSIQKKQWTQLSTNNHLFNLVPTDSAKTEAKKPFFKNDTKKIDFAFCLAILSVAALLGGLLFTPLVLVALGLALLSLYIAYPLRRQNTIAFVATIISICTTIVSFIAALILVGVIVFLIYIFLQALSQFGFN
jgi:hypothetical protein